MVLFSNSKPPLLNLEYTFGPGIRDNLHMSLYGTFTETHSIHSCTMYPSPHAANLAIRILFLHIVYHSNPEGFV